LGHSRRNPTDVHKMEVRERGDTQGGTEERSPVLERRVRYEYPMTKARRNGKKRKLGELPNQGFTVFLKKKLRGV